MTEAIEVRPNVASCGNCWGEAEIPEEHRKTTGRPEGWATALITTNKGILTNNLICDGCLTSIKNALADRRVKDEDAVPDVTVPNTAVAQKVADAKEAGATQVTVEQVGTGKTATVDISEFEGQSYQELVDASVTEEAKDSPPVQVPSTATQDSPPVQEDAPEAPKGLSNRAKQRARAAVSKVEAEVKKEEG